MPRIDKLESVLYPIALKTLLDKRPEYKGLLEKGLIVFKAKMYPDWMDAKLMRLADPCPLEACYVYPIGHGLGIQMANAKKGITRISCM